MNNASAIPLLLDDAVDLERATELVQHAIHPEDLNNPLFNFGNHSLSEFLPRLIVSVWKSPTRRVYVPYEILLRNADFRASQTLIKESLDKLPIKLRENAEHFYNKPKNYAHVLNQVDQFGPVNMPNFLPKYNLTQEKQSIATYKMATYLNIAVILGIGFIWANREWFTPADLRSVPTGCQPAQRGRFITYCGIEDNNASIEEMIHYLLGYDRRDVKHMFDMLQIPNASNVSQPVHEESTLLMPLLNKE
jgi:hypothetical protein